MRHAEQEYVGDQEVQIAGAECASKAHFAVRISTDRVEIDIGSAVDLRTAEEKRVNTSLCGAVEQFFAAISKAGVFATAENGYA